MPAGGKTQNAHGRVQPTCNTMQMCHVYWFSATSDGKTAAQQQRKKIESESFPPASNPWEKSMDVIITTPSSMDRIANSNRNLHVWNRLFSLLLIVYEIAAHKLSGTMLPAIIIAAQIRQPQRGRNTPMFQLVEIVMSASGKFVVSTWVVVGVELFGRECTCDREQ